MNIIKSYGTGIQRATAERKMVFLLWAVNIIFASAIYFLVSSYTEKALGNSEASETLLNKFDFGLFLEILVHNGGPVMTIALAAFILGFTYFWISVFLNGGILYSLIEARKFNGPEVGRMSFMSVFFHGSGKFFGRFFRLSLYALLLWLACGLVFFMLNAATKPLMANGLNERAVFYLTATKVLAGLILFLLIRMILDYARIAIVNEDSREVFRALMHAVGFVFGKAGGTLGLYYLLLLTGGVLFAFFWVFNSVIPAKSYFSIMFSFLVGQIFILSRGWLKIAFQASQLRFYTLKR